MVPEGWRTSAIGDLLERCDYGINYKLSADAIGTPVLRMGNIQDSRLDLSDLKYADLAGNDEDRVLLRQGDVLFNRTNSKDNVAKVAFVDTDRPLSFASYLVRLRTVANEADARWLFYRLDSPDLQAHFRRIATKGVSQVNVNPTKMRETETVLPPLPEQRKIAAILTAVDETIEKTAAVIEQLGIVKKAMMQELLTRGLPGRHARFKKTEIGEVPEEWQVVKLGELCSLVTKGTTPAKHEMSDGVGDVPYLKVYNITKDGHLDFTYQPTYVPRSVHEGPLARSRVKPGDVLMNIVGPPLGKAALVPDWYSEWNINQAICVFRTGPELQSTFALACLQSEHIFGWARKRAKRTSTQLNLTLQICRDLPIPVPGVEEQREVCQLIDAVTSRLTTETEALRAERNLKSALMSVLLTGELRVTTGTTA